MPDRTMTIDDWNIWFTGFQEQQRQQPWGTMVCANHCSCYKNGGSKYCCFCDVRREPTPEPQCDDDGADEYEGD